MFNPHTTDTIKFSTKAQTIKSLEGCLRGGEILPSFVFTVREWQQNAQRVLDDLLKNNWASQEMVVRSSAIAEDTLNESNAGKFESYLNVKAADLSSAIEDVIKSYGDCASVEDQVLIQPHLQDVCISGVVFTADPNTGGFYYVLNYQEGNDTAAVTSGKTDNVKTTIIHKNSPVKKMGWMKSLCDLCNELENLFCHPYLDIEFAVDSKGVLYLLQVRPLIVNITHNVSFEDQSEVLQHIESKVKQHSSPHPYLHGKKTVFGIMPDWNPAEIIGVKPKSLALSLYKDLITDNIWAYQRDNYGYKNLRSFPLLIDFFGKPYIDVRVSFNSFLPKEINDDLANRLIEFYIQKLINKPELHDKVEFDIVYSCYTFDLAEKLEELKDFGFSNDDCQIILDSLRSLSNKIINRHHGLWKEDLEKIEKLKLRHQRLLESDLDPIARAYWLLEDCKRYGTLPFAGLARAGFIAVQILNSMVEVGALSIEQKFSFLNNLDTISSKIKKDLLSLDKSSFLSKYGHLRPGTYDIASPRYDEEPDLYFDWHNIQKGSCEETPEFHLTLSQMGVIENLLKDHCLEHDVLGLFSFLKVAIEGREYAKFVFTKNLSDALSLINKLGELHGFTPEEMAYVDINTIKDFYSSGNNIKEKILCSIARGKKSHQITKSLTLPTLITNPDEVWQFDFQEAKPNFITQKNVTASVVSDLSNKENLEGKLVFILNADPGYDWIFTHNIAGFITAYGGVNSHMAIRAGELGLPAVVGAGDVLFQKWSKAKLISLNCLNQQVEIIH